MKYPQCRILLLTKAPEIGKVKTRLIPLLGDTAATELYARLLHNSLTLCTSARLCPVELWCSPSAEHPFFQHCRQRYNVELQTQSPGDLGQRMSDAIKTSLQQSSAVILIGADCPDLTSTDLEAALDALQAGTDVVIGPAKDGGYYLIGQQLHQAALFNDMAWGTATVLTDTLERCQRLDLSLHQLDVHSDLDTPEDYAVYRKRELNS